MDKSTKRLYLRKMRKQTLFAHIVNLVLSAAVTFIVSELLLRSFGFGNVPAFVCAVCGVIIFLVSAKLLNDIRLSRFIKKERKRIKEEEKKLRILLCSEAEFREKAEKIAEQCKRVFVHQSTEPVSCDFLLECYRSAKQDSCSEFLIASITDLDSDAKVLTEKLSDVRISVCFDELLKSTESISDDKADELFAIQNRAERVPLLKRIKTCKAPSPYLVCGLFLLCLSPFIRYGLYFRLVGGLCMWIAAFYYVIKRRYSE